MNPLPSASASPAPTMKPRASMPATRSTSSPASRYRSASSSMARANPAGSASNVVMSRNWMPGRGKSGMVRISDLMGMGVTVSRLATALHPPPMPELPEVETTRRGLAPHLVGRTVTGVVQRLADLRWPYAPELRKPLPGQRIEAVRRRAKYLLLDTEAGSPLLHLGMSGSLRVLPGDLRAGLHDHLDLALDNG